MKLPIQNNELTLRFFYSWGMLITTSIICSIFLLLENLEYPTSNEADLRITLFTSILFISIAVMTIKLISSGNNIPTAGGSFYLLLIALSAVFIFFLNSFLYDLLYYEDYLRVTKIFPPFKWSQQILETLSKDLLSYKIHQWGIPLMFSILYIFIFIQGLKWLLKINIFRRTQNNLKLFKNATNMIFKTSLIICYSLIFLFCASFSIFTHIYQLDSHHQTLVIDTQMIQTADSVDSIRHQLKQKLEQKYPK